MSCEKNSLKMNNQIETKEFQTSEYRSSSVLDSFFRLNLNNLADMFNSANDASNGDLALLLESLDTVSSSSAFTILDNAGLINVIDLENAIDQTAYYEGLLLLSYSHEDIENIVNQEVNDLQELFKRPFWGDDCETDLVGGVSDGECVYRTTCANRYRFWINFGPKTSDSEPFDCL